MATKGDMKNKPKIVIDEELLKHRERRRSLEDKGDMEAVRRLDFGFHIFRMRTMADMTQDEAARAAGINRKTWGRVESGYFTPQLIPKLAKALSLDEARLYRRAGLEAPKGTGSYDIKRAQMDLDRALLESENLASFFTQLQRIWMLYKLEKLGLRRHFAMDSAHARVFASALNLTGLQRVELASMLVEGAKKEMAKTPPLRKLVKDGFLLKHRTYFDNRQRLYDQLDSELERSRKGKSPHWKN